MNYKIQEPDISVICDLNKIDEKGCNGAPDWIIEIVSPGSKSGDYLIKLFKYRPSDIMACIIRVESRERGIAGFLFLFVPEDNFT